MLWSKVRLYCGVPWMRAMDALDLHQPGKVAPRVQCGSLGSAMVSTVPGSFFFPTFLASSRLHNALILVALTYPGLRRGRRTVSLVTRACVAHSWHGFFSALSPGLALQVTLPGNPRGLSTGDRRKYLGIFLYEKPSSGKLRLGVVLPPPYGSSS